MGYAKIVRPARFETAANEEDRARVAELVLIAVFGVFAGLGLANWGAERTRPAPSPASPAPAPPHSGPAGPDDGRQPLAAVRLEGPPRQPRQGPETQIKPSKVAAEGASGATLDNGDNLNGNNLNGNPAAVASAAAASTHANDATRAPVTDMAMVDPTTVMSRWPVGDPEPPRDSGGETDQSGQAQGTDEIQTLEPIQVPTQSHMAALAETRAQAAAPTNPAREPGAGQGSVPTGSPGNPQASLSNANPGPPAAGGPAGGALTGASPAGGASQAEARPEAPVMRIRPAGGGAPASPTPAPATRQGQTASTRNGMAVPVGRTGAVHRTGAAGASDVVSDQRRRNATASARTPPQQPQRTQQPQGDATGPGATPIVGEGEASRFKLGRVAYLRCKGVEQPGAKYPCPRDKHLELRAWAVLRDLATCAAADDLHGTGDVRLSFVTGRPWPEVLWAHVPGTNLPEGPLQTCVGARLRGLRTRLNANHLLVSVRFKLR